MGTLVAPNWKLLGPKVHQDAAGFKHMMLAYSTAAYHITVDVRSMYTAGHPNPAAGWIVSWGRGDVDATSRDWPAAAII